MWENIFEAGSLFGAILVKDFVSNWTHKKRYKMSLIFSQSDAENGVKINEIRFVTKSEKPGTHHEEIGARGEHPSHPLLVCA